MIPAERFIVESTDRSAWLTARAPGVTATEVAEAATPAGFQHAMNHRLAPAEEPDNDYMRFGRENEAWIAMVIKRETGIMPNRWLIAAENPLHLATPDGLSLDHLEIAEIKTGGTAITKPTAKHYRQIQWQLYVTGAERCRFGFMLRTPTFQPAWLDPYCMWVERDEKAITQLIDVADRLVEATQERMAA